MEVTKQQNDIIASIVLNGDVSKLNNDQRVLYVKQVCDRLGIDWTTQPFQILRLNGKERLYATKDATDQVRKVNGVSIYKLDKSIESGLCIFTAYAKDKSGKEDASSGAVPIEGLKGEALANAIMKAETKAKRRVTLSICGLGMLDENEVDSIPDAKTAPIETVNVTAEVVGEEERTPTVDELHKEFLDLLDVYASYKGEGVTKQYHPKNWTAHELKNYQASIKEIRSRIQAEQKESLLADQTK